MTKSFAIACCLSLSFAACGGDDDDGGDMGTQIDCSKLDGFDIYSPDMEFEGDAYNLVLAEADPAPPAKGPNNDWTFQVLDGATPVDGLTVDVLPFMPFHGHGTDPVVVTAGTDPGTYEAPDINLFMPGIWETTVTVDDGDSSEKITFSFCIDG